MGGLKPIDSVVLYPEGLMQRGSTQSQFPTVLSIVTDSSDDPLGNTDLEQYRWFIGGLESSKIIYQIGLVCKFD
jgi:hypothetical protein